MKKVFALLLVLVMTLAFMATATAEGEVKVAFITQSLANASQAYAWTQFQKWAPDYGFTVQVFDEDYNAENGDRAIHQAIADGYDAICINPTDDEMRNMIRRHITFYGWVQGVGFRYRARHAAELYGCTGWVRNEWDGSVTMEIQGTEENIDCVILAIEAGRYVKIENMDSRMIPVESEERGFRTR